MAKISFDSIPAGSNAENNSDQIGFFSLKNDKEEAIVRIMEDSVEGFELLTTHPINVDGKFRTVSCIRTPQEPIDNCPLCKNNTKIQSKIFIKMIQYVTDSNGQITPKPVVWERSAFTWGNKLKNFMAEYGPLSENLFKIRRDGAKGSMETRFEVMYANPNMYREEMYPKMPDAFNNYSALGRVVLDKNYDEICSFIATGKFPAKPKVEPTANTPTGETRVPYEAPSTHSVSNTADSYTPQNTTTPSTDTLPWNNNSQAPARPTRYY